MKFLIPPDFDLQMFLNGCDVDGVRLFKADGPPEPDGHAVRTGNLLSIQLYAPSEVQENFVTLNVEAQGGTPE